MNASARALALLAAAGLTSASLSACATSVTPADDHTASGAKGKNCCRGKNECKGKGGCKTTTNECAGKNECKGKGGCSHRECG